MPSVFVIILSAIFLGQVLLPVEAVGTLIILAGVVLVQLKSRRKLPQDNLKPTESDG
jgi:drug/metabolite transporter (DMT)-like permease